eukprot:TRINITY_DN289_c1_g1_i1.p1 TRINITY_DN289_c1_g1~~TRINITY_DN289_c1_g1_i1.p1  ORF type:complete len:137 (-),score=57.42 TRINITY_DN289_c1_g1_i1:120-482(-)
MSTTDFRKTFEEKAAAERAAVEKKEREAAELAKKKAERQGGSTAIGTKKGQIKAFATAFQAKAEGHDVELTETKGGWAERNVTSAPSGKWEGGAAGVKAKVIQKEEPKGPPPKKSITDFK